MPLGISAGTAALIGGGISAAGGVASSLIQSGNAGKAGAQTQRNLQLMLPQMQTNYNTAVQGYQPYAAAGGQAFGAETDLLGLNGPDAASTAMSRYQTSPGYDFQMQEGLRAVDALGAAGRSLPGLRSGATVKAEQKYGSDLASLDFGNYWNRLNNLASTGFTATADIAGAGNNLIAGMQGNATGQNTAITNQADAQNSATGNLFSGLGNTVNSLLVNPAVQQTLGIGNPFPSGNVTGTQNNTGLIPSGGFAPSGKNTWYW